MVEIIALRKIPIIKRGDNIGDHIVRAAKAEHFRIVNRDIIVIAQKIVSKAEGHVIRLKNVTPSQLAEQIAKDTEKDPRLVETILRESAGIVRMGRGHLIVETRHGFVCANAGVDRSNAPGQDSVVLLP